MLKATTIIETGKRTFKKGEEIVKSAFKKSELDSLIEAGIIEDVEEVEENVDSEGQKTIQFTNSNTEGESEEDDPNSESNNSADAGADENSKNANPPADGEETDTDEE